MNLEFTWPLIVLLKSIDLSLAWGGWGRGWGRGTNIYPNLDLPLSYPIKPQSCSKKQAWNLVQHVVLSNNFLKVGGQIFGPAVAGSAGPVPPPLTYDHTLNAQSKSGNCMITY